MPIKIDREATGKNIRKRCDDSHISPETLSRLLNLDLTTVYYWFKGKTFPKWETAFNLAALVGCNVADLFVLEKEEDE